MKSFHLTVWAVSLFFFAVMAVVCTLSFLRKTNATHIDPAEIRNLREKLSQK